MREFQLALSEVTLVDPVGGMSSERDVQSFQTFLLFCQIESLFVLNFGDAIIYFVMSSWQRCPKSFTRLEQQSLLTILLSKNILEKTSSPHIRCSFVAQLLKYFSCDDNGLCAQLLSIGEPTDGSGTSDETPVLTNKLKLVKNTNNRPKVWDEGMTKSLGIFCYR